MGLARTVSFLSLAATLAAIGGCAGRTMPTGALPNGMTVPPESLVTARGNAVSARAFSRRIHDAAYLLLGEEHPNPCDHLAQAATIARLVKAGIRPVIGLEMVPADRQHILDAFNAGRLAVADLPAALSWRTTWGFDFSLYAPIFETAREYDLPVFALNTPAGLTRKVGRVGLDGLTPKERASLPGALLPPDPAQVKALREIYEAHREHLPPPKKGRTAPHQPSEALPFSFESFLSVQSLWDTQMASRARLARARYDRPVVIVAGGGHVEQGFGIAHRLHSLDPKAAVVSVMPWRGGDLPDPAEADLFYVCPAIHKNRLGMTLSQESTAKGTAATPLLVTEVAPDSPAARAGLLPGDAITAASDAPATSLSDLHKAAISAAMAGKPLILTVSRATETLTLAIALPAPPRAK